MYAALCFPKWSHVKSTIVYTDQGSSTTVFNIDHYEPSKKHWWLLNQESNLNKDGQAIMFAFNRARLLWQTNASGCQ